MVIQISYREIDFSVTTQEFTTPSSIDGMNSHTTCTRVVVAYLRTPRLHVEGLRLHGLSGPLLDECGPLFGREIHVPAVVTRIHPSGYPHANVDFLNDD